MGQDRGRYFCEVYRFAPPSTLSWTPLQTPLHVLVCWLQPLKSLVLGFIPRNLGPSGLFRSDSKRPDVVFLVPSKGRKALVLDATCTDTFASSYSTLVAREAGAVTEDAERKKVLIFYALLEPNPFFVPLAV